MDRRAMTGPLPPRSGFQAVLAMARIAERIRPVDYDPWRLPPAERDEVLHVARSCGLTLLPDAARPWWEDRRG
jgi:hypothetical protein